MAIDMCSERSRRISFSHDNAQTGVGRRHVERFRPHPDSFLLDTNSDFAFCVDHTDEHKPSTADELFSNGIILPMQIQERTHSYSEKFRKHESHHPTFSYSSLAPPLPSNTPENSKRESLRELLMVNEADERRPQPKKQVSSFWGFKRSASLNCDSSYKISLICSLPLLSRSHSTGSMAHSNKSRHKQGSASMARSSSSSSSSSSSTSSSSSQNKAPLKKSYGENSGVPPCISKGTHTTRSVCFNLTV